MILGVISMLLLNRSTDDFIAIFLAVSDCKSCFLLRSDITVIAILRLGHLSASSSKVMGVCVCESVCVCVCESVCVCVSREAALRKALCIAVLFRSAVGNIP